MNWIEALGPTALTLLGGAAGWFLKSHWEVVQRQNEKLRDERAETYMTILEPFAKLLTDLSPESQEASLSQLQSFEYRKVAFRLALVGDDEVIREWNRMWQSTYKAEQGGDKKEILRGFGRVLLAIRRSIGAKKTKLGPSEMLRWLIKDADELFR